jgi:hypothetical protein
MPIGHSPHRRAVGHSVRVATEYVAAVCADGPFAGLRVTAFNSLGWSATISSLTSEPENKQAACIYEVEALDSPDEPAVLRFVREAS